MSGQNIIQLMKWGDMTTYAEIWINKLWTVSANIPLLLNIVAMDE